MIQDGYSICFNRWVLDTRIKNELPLLLIISSLTAKTSECFASNSYFATLFDCTEVSISQKINKLINYGYLSVEYEKRGAEIKKRVLRLKNFLIDDSNIFYPTIKNIFKDNNISINNTSNKKENIIKEKICFDNVVDWETLFTYWENNKSGGKYKNKESRNRMLDRLKKLTDNNFEFAKECIVFCIDSGYQGFCNGNELYYKHTPVKDEKTICIADGQFFCDNSMEEFKDMTDEQCYLAVGWLLRNFRYSTIPYSKFVSMVRKFKS